MEESYHFRESVRGRQILPAASGGPSLHIEYENTPEDLYAFQWRAVFVSSRGRRARRNVYLVWVLAVVLFGIIPAIGADGFVFSRISFGFILVALPIGFVLQWLLERWVIKRTIRSLLKDERPDRGQLGRHRVVLGEDGLIESTAVNESRTAWAGVDRGRAERGLHLHPYLARDRARHPQACLQRSPGGRSLFPPGPEPQGGSGVSTPRVPFFEEPRRHRRTGALSSLRRCGDVVG